MASIAELPREVLSIIASHADYESLVSIGSTCSALWRFVSSDANGHWKALHNSRWTCGKRDRLDCLPSQRPHGGVSRCFEDESLDWRKEFVRRFVLDKSVVGLLERMEKKGCSSEVLEALKEAGADIFGQLKLLTNDSECFAAAATALCYINVVEANSDLDKCPEDVYCLDSNMAATKRGQEAEDLVRRKSSDEIYDRINSESHYRIEGIDVVRTLSSPKRQRLPLLGGFPIYYSSDH